MQQQQQQQQRLRLQQSCSCAALLLVQMRSSSPEAEERNEKKIVSAHAASLVLLSCLNDQVDHLILSECLQDRLGAMVNIVCREYHVTIPNFQVRVGRIPIEDEARLDLPNDKVPMSLFLNIN